MNKKELSYRKQIMIQCVINGLCWIVSGVTSCFKGKVFGLISVIAMAIGMVFMISIFIRKRQSADEMATANLNQAAATAFWIGQMILMLFYLVFNKFLMELTGIRIDLNPYFSGSVLVFLGILNVIVGLGFKKLEEE